MAARLTVLIDEDCGICTQLGAWLGRRDGITVDTIGSSTGARLLRDLPPSARYAAVHVVDEQGRRFSAGAALPLVLSRLPAGRGPAALAAALPQATERAYQLVARHRSVLSRLAGLQACSVGHEAGQTGRAGTDASLCRRGRGR